MEACFLPLTPTDATVASDYREELIKVLSSARQCTAEAIQKAQVRYKTQYDKSTKAVQYKVGEWILIKHPQEETGLCILYLYWGQAGNF